MTPRPPNVRIARQGDAERLLALVVESATECASGQRDYAKVEAIIGLALDRTPLFDDEGVSIQRPIFGVIDGPDAIEGACGLYPTQPWDSSDHYLRGFFHYVGRAYRPSDAPEVASVSWREEDGGKVQRRTMPVAEVGRFRDSLYTTLRRDPVNWSVDRALRPAFPAHGKSLIQWGAWFADQSGLMLVWELVHPERVPPKAKMFERLATPLFALYAHAPEAEAEAVAA